jgi:hypothetical protein
MLDLTDLASEAPWIVEERSSVYRRETMPMDEEFVEPREMVRTVLVKTLITS